MTRFAAGLIVLGVFCAATPRSVRAEVSARVEPTSGTASDIYTLQVTVSGNRGGEISEPRFEQTDQFELTSLGTTQSRRVSNGALTYAVTFSFQVTPNQSLPPGSYKLPGGALTIDGDNVPIPTPKLKIVSGSDPGSQDGAPDPNASVRFSQSAEPAEVYLGQQLLYDTRIVTTSSFAEGNLGEVAIKGAWREKLDKQEKLIERYGDYTVTTVSEVLIPTETGTLDIPRRDLQATILVEGRRRGGSLLDELGFGGLRGFGGMTAKRRFSAPPVKVNVLPLPPGPQTEQNYIPVGKLKVRATVDNKEIALGDSVTLNVVVSGTGNLRPLELPAASGNPDSYKRYDDKPELLRDIQQKWIVFTKVFKLALVPKEQGSFLTPQFTIFYFDPEDKRYETIKPEQFLIKIGPSAEGQKLVVSSANNAAVNTPAVPGQSDVAILGEDLLPQHEGAYLYAEQPRISGSLWYLLLCGAPLVSIMLRMLFIRGQMLAMDPLRRLQIAAYSKALENLKTAEADPDRLYKLIANYLGERFRVTGASLTAREAEELVSAKTNPELGASVAALLRRLQTLLYSNAQVPAGELSALRDQVKQLLERIQSVSQL